MKPKTAIQKEIIEDSKLLPKVTEEQTKYALDKIHDKFVAVSYSKKHYCLECSHNWEQSVKETKIKKSCVCPSCNNKLKLTENPHHSQTAYYSIITTVNNKQVVRMFWSRKSHKKGSKFTHSLSEVIQHYITEDGKIHSILAPTNGFSGYYDSWTRGGELEFRTPSYTQQNQIKLSPWVTYPKTKVLPIIKRNGFKNSAHNIRPHHLLQSLIKNNRIESLFKLKQYSLVKSIIHEDFNVNEYWNEIKIAIKNDYKIKDLSDWKDYIDLLKLFNKDVKNAKYVCPKNLHKEHNKYVEKRQRIEDAQDFEKKKKSIKKEDIQYQIDKAKFLNLTIKGKGIEIKTLQSVQAFYEEGKELKHCVYSSNYHKRDNTLVLSATKNGAKLETIDIDLVNLKINQSRGKFNKKTKYNSTIMELVNNNMSQIQQIAS